MKKNKILNILIVSVLMLVNLNTYRVKAAANVSISAPGSTSLGNQVTITVNNNNGDYSVAGLLSVSGAASGSLNIGLNSSGSQSLTVTASKTGTINITFSGEAADQNKAFLPDYQKEKVTRTASVQVSGGQSGGSGNNSSGSTSDLSVRAETEEERAAREKREAEAELKEREKTPLIKDINISSESTRLKGKKVVSLKSEKEKFDYSATLPRNIDEFKIDLTPVAEDVELTYDKMYKLDANHDKVEIIVKAVQDEVKQEFKITVKRHKSSEVTFESDDLSLTLLNDNLIDKALKEYGIEKKLFDKDKDDTFYYYEYGNYKFALTFDEDNVARWVFLDDKGKFLDEFVLVIDQHDKPRFLVNVELEEKPTLQGNRYDAKELVLPESITSLDESITFNNMINAWEFDETGVITHEYVEVESKDLASTDEELIDVEKSTPYKLVYVGKDAVVESAFVAFDEVNQNMMYLAISLFALLVLLLIVFIVYWRSTSKKINKLISRNSY